jgi:putative ABC transport system permease protein
MSAFGYARRSFVRALWRNVAYLMGLTVAVALFSGTLFFIDGSMRTMTQRALAPVQLDFQARAVDAQSDVTQFATELARHRSVRAVLPFASASAHIVRAGALDQPLPIRLLGLPPDYSAQFPLLVSTSGQLTPDGALVSDQLAATFGVKPGDTFELDVPGLHQPYQVTVTGTIDTDLAEPLFSGPSAAPEGTFNGAAAVVAIDHARFQRDLSTALQATADSSSPALAMTNGGLPLLDRQLHVRLERGGLAADPGVASTQIAALRSQLERQAPGQVKITDNLSSALTNAARDVVSARLLFVFLGLPGVLLAAYLARYSASLVTEAQRRDVALLRARGLAPRDVLAIMSWIAGFTAVAGTVAGLLLAALGTVLIFGTAVLEDGAALARSAAAALGAGVLLGGIGVFLPARRMVAGEIAEERRQVSGPTRPAWLRIHLDIGLLAAAGLAVWFSGSYNSRAAASGASETAAVSLGVYAFLGPLLFWLGAALFLWRVSDGLLSRPANTWRGGLGGLVSRSLRRRRAQSSGAALLLALAVSFGMAGTIFSASFDASRRSDARYLIGSDLRVTPAVTNPQPPSFANELEVPGVRAVAPVWVANNVLLGSQTQVVYGIDVDAMTRATSIEDSFFVDAGAHAVLDRLRATPDGLLVSTELAAAYNIEAGDTVAMRIPAATGGFVDAKLRVLAAFVIFPTSSQNSDLVVNRALLTAATGTPNVAFFLVHTEDGAATAEAVANTLKQRFANRMAIRIETADRAVSQDQSSLVGVNLAGLTGLERLYSALVVGLALAVYLLGSIVERRRELGTLEALGMTVGQVTWLLVLEGALLAAAGVVGGAIVGVVLARQYNGFLPGIFSVPIPVVALPIPDLVFLLVLAFAGVAAAAVLASLRLRRLWPVDVLREL